jgi:hypothetical protein
MYGVTWCKITSLDLFFQEAAMTRHSRLDMLGHYTVLNCIVMYGSLQDEAHPYYPSVFKHKLSEQMNWK